MVQIQGIFQKPEREIDRMPKIHQREIKLKQ